MSRAKRLWSLLTAFAVTLFMLPSLSVPIYADDAEPEYGEPLFSYNISGYNKWGIIKGPDGETVPGMAYCLDYKQSTPGGGYFTRVKLSDITTYEKGSYDDVKNFDDDVKRRLLSIMMDWSDITAFIDAMDFTSEKAWLEKNCSGYTSNGFYKAVSNVRDRQVLIWTVVHPESEWETFVNDEGQYTTPGHSDIYKWRESKGFSNLYPYVPAAPETSYTDPHSMWNVVFKPIIDYIDTMPDRYAEGYDAWVYFPEFNTTQSMLGEPFKAVDEASVKISKVDITGGEELEGAHIQILDENGSVVEEWDSETTAHETAALAVETVYTLRETVAPEGYAITSDTKFVIGADGQIDISWISAKYDSNKDVILVEDSITSVSVSKVDITSSEEVAGAHIQILDEDEYVVDEWDSEATAHIVEGLITGKTYTLRETVAPDGYAVSADTTFVLAPDGTIDTENTTASVKNGVLLVEDSKTKVSISKVDVATSEEVEGAHIQILDGDTVVEEWDSASSAHEIEGLLTGKTYTLRETVAPDGYAITSDTTFTLAADGTVDAASTAQTDGNGVILVEDTKTKVNISKVDITSSEELAGAHIQILDGDKVVEEWDSETTAHTVEGLVTGKTYTLRETVAPDGYAITSDTTFALRADGTIDADNTTSTTDDNGGILIEDTKTVVKVSKVDAADSKEIAGAHIQILDGETVVEEWDSTTTAHIVEGLIAGKTYTLRETVAPQGYAITSDTTFTIAADGTVTSSATMSSEGVILIADGRNTVKVKKTDIDTSEELEGAKLQVLDESGNAVDEWTSSKEAHEVTGLVSGMTYTLRETVAPEGYAITSDIKFGVASNGTVTADGKTVSDGVILVEDSLTDVKVKKVNKHGDGIEGAKMQILDAAGTEVASWTSNGQVYSVKGLKAGVEYTIHEAQAPSGYELAKDTAFVINADGSIETEAKVEDGIIMIEDLVKIMTDEDSHDSNAHPDGSAPDSMVVETTEDGPADSSADTPAPAPALATSIFPDGTTKTPSPAGVVSDTPDERLVTEDTPEGNAQGSGNVEGTGNVEEVDSGAAASDKGETRTETGVFAIAAVMIIALAVSILSRKRAK